MRSGLALIIESDFYATDAGRQHFADRKRRASNPTTFLPPRKRRLTRWLPCAELTSIRYCVQEVRSAPPQLLRLSPATTHASPFRAQTCNYDMLYAVRSRASNHRCSTNPVSRLCPR